MLSWKAVYSECSGNRVRLTGRDQLLKQDTFEQSLLTSPFTCVG